MVKPATEVSDSHIYGLCALTPSLGRLTHKLHAITPSDSDSHIYGLSTLTPSLGRLNLKLHPITFGEAVRLHTLRFL